MAKATKKECWDLIEDKLVSISENKTGRHVGEAKLAISVLIAAGRDNDVEWIMSNLFDFYCQVANLSIPEIRRLMMYTILSLRNGDISELKQSLLEA